ncbi:MAG: hypothetical protein ACRDD2_11250 [Sarcina sp.]
MRKRNFYFFHREKFYIYREDLTEEGAIIISIETLEKNKKGSCLVIKSKKIGAVSGIETFAMGVSTKLFKWQILEAIEEYQEKEELNPIVGNLEYIKTELKELFPIETTEGAEEIIEIIDDNAGEMGLKEKKRFSLFSKNKDL